MMATEHGRPGCLALARLRRGAMVGAARLASVRPALPARGPAFAPLARFAPFVRQAGLARLRSVPVAVSSISVRAAMPAWQKGPRSRAPRNSPAQARLPPPRLAIKAAPIRTPRRAASARGWSLPGRFRRGPAPAPSARARPARPGPACRLSPQAALPPLPEGRTGLAVPTLRSPHAAGRVQAAMRATWPDGASVRRLAARTGRQAARAPMRPAWAPAAARLAPVAPIGPAATVPALMHDDPWPDAAGPTPALDRMELGRWLTDHLAREVARPPQGLSGFDDRLTPTFAGAVGPG